MLFLNEKLGMPNAEFGAYIKSEIANCAKVIKDAGIKAD